VVSTCQTPPTRAILEFPSCGKSTKI
jgi:hypothetical protein